MAIKYNVAINVCDDCGHRWLPEGKSVRCPNRKCRSRHWNDSEAIIEDEDEIETPASPTREPANTLDLIARLGLTTASKLHEEPSTRPTLPPAEDIEPQLPMCSYTEYDSDTGETYHCGLRQHSFKVKHTRGARI